MEVGIPIFLVVNIPIMILLMSRIINVSHLGLLPVVGRSTHVGGRVVNLQNRLGNKASNFGKLIY